MTARPVAARGRTTAPATLLGALAILFWGSNMAFTRSLTEDLGQWTAAAALYLTSGTLGTLFMGVRPGGLRRLAGLPRLYLIGCGALFVAYAILLYVMVGSARDRAQMIEAGIVHYLWPCLTLVLSVPVLNKRATWGLLPGMLLGFAGMFLAMTETTGFDRDVFMRNLRENPLPYATAILAAFVWSLYSNLSRRWAAHCEGDAISPFLFVSGCVFLMIRWFVPETPVFTARAGVELAYLAVFPTVVSYTFWDIAMRRGNVVLVAALSYCIPLLSTVISCAYLDVAAGWRIWIACVFVIAGAILCKMSIVDLHPGRRPLP